MRKATELDAVDRQIINTLQGGFPVVDEPFKAVSSWQDIKQDNLLARIGALIENGIVSRFGPLYNSQALGGAVTLAAMCVPEERFDEVASMVNTHHQVAHNYARSHALNMWFVIATESPGQISEVITAIERETGLEVFNLPKEKEYFIGLRLEA